MRVFGSYWGCFFFGAFGCPRPPAVGLGVVASAATEAAGAAGVEGTTGVVGVVFVRTTTVESGFVITIGLEVVTGTVTTAEGVMGAEEDSC